MSEARENTNYDAKALGTTIRLLRERLQLTQTDLGRLSSFSAAEISKLESGTRKKIPIETLIKIAPHLNVSLDYLLASCISDFKSDYERFFDFNGKELDLYKLAQNIYSVDSSFLLLLSSSDFLTDKKTIYFFKSWIKLKSAIDNTTDKSGILKTIFENFKTYCFTFIETLLRSLNDKSTVEVAEDCNKFILKEGEHIKNDTVTASFKVPTV